MPIAIRFFAYHTAIGMAVGLLATAGIYFSNFMGIGDMLARSEMRWLFLALMVLFLGTTLSAIQIAFALLAKGEERD
jgi:hypothetical protein